jgi:signal transduction histidine kinase
VLFLGTTLGFWAALGWLGWRSLKQDEDLEAQYVRERIEGAANEIAGDIRRTLAEFESQLDQLAVLPAANLPQALAASSLRLTDDALIVAFDARAVQAFPRQRLLYYPVLPAFDEPYISPLVPSRAYAQLETSPASAIELFAAVAASDDARTRGEALLGLARGQAKLGRAHAALATYAELHDPDVLIEGRPAELLARVGRCQLLASLGQRAQLVEEARRLNQDLAAGRWQLTRTAYLHYAGEVRNLVGSDVGALDGTAPSDVAVALAEGVGTLWAQWQAERPSPAMAPGRASRVFSNQPVLLMWRATGERFVALVAGPGFLEDRIIGPLRNRLEREGAQIVLADGEGQAVLSLGTSGPETQRTTRHMAETRLPWNLFVVSADPQADLKQFATRRQTIVAGLVFLALFVVAGSYFSVRAMTREIEAARLKSDFVAAVSHEFRTPLTLLRQFSDLLAEDRVSSESERRRYYAALQRGTRRLTRLVEDLLDFGRIEAGSRAFSLQPVAARACIEAVTSEFQEEIGSRGYTLEVAWHGPTDVMIDADAAALGRALWNLFDNAVKYSPECRTVWVTSRYAEGRLTIGVRDRGLGVSADERRAIFHKFVRGSASGGHVIKGTGLGLALVEQIVSAHCGTVQLESVAGEGSTFSITLPARVEADAKEQPRWRVS